jgi:hypothetical protein
MFDKFTNHFMNYTQYYFISVVVIVAILFLYQLEVQRASKVDMCNKACGSNIVHGCSQENNKIVAVCSVQQFYVVTIDR